MTFSIRDRYYFMAYQVRKTRRPRKDTCNHSAELAWSVRKYPAMLPQDYPHWSQMVGMLSGRRWRKIACVGRSATTVIAMLSRRAGIVTRCNRT